jgi:hypothetical protein
MIRITLLPDFEGNYQTRCHCQPNTYIQSISEQQNYIVFSRMIYLTAIRLTPGGSSTVHIYTQQYTEQHSRHKTIHRTTQFTN